MAREIDPELRELRAIGATTSEGERAAGNFRAALKKKMARLVGAQLKDTYGRAMFQDADEAQQPTTFSREALQPTVYSRETMSRLYQRDPEYSSAPYEEAVTASSSGALQQALEETGMTEEDAALYLKSMRVQKKRRQQLSGAKEATKDRQLLIE
jgi:hypothetical protein